MCDHVHYDQLEGRVDQMESRLTAVETSIEDMRRECKTGFEKLGADLCRIYDERAKWSAWTRENLGHALRWAGVIILTACGITQASSIIQQLTKAFGHG